MKSTFSRWNRWLLVSFLVPLVASASTTDDGQLCRLLLAAAEEANVAAVQFLAKQFRKDNSGKPFPADVVTTSIERGLPADTLRALLDVPIALRLPDSKNRTPLQVAQQVKNEDALALLKEHGIAPEKLDVGDENPLPLLRALKELKLEKPQIRAVLTRAPEQHQWIVRGADGKALFGKTVIGAVLLTEAVRIRSLPLVRFLVELRGIPLTSLLRYSDRAYDIQVFEGVANALLEDKDAFLDFLVKHKLDMRSVLNAPKETPGAHPQGLPSILEVVVDTDRFWTQVPDREVVAHRQQKALTWLIANGYDAIADSGNLQMKHKYTLEKFADRDVLGRLFLESNPLRKELLASLSSELQNAWADTPSTADPKAENLFLRLGVKNPDTLLAVKSGYRRAKAKFAKDAEALAALGRAYRDLNSSTKISHYADALKQAGETRQETFERWLKEAGIVEESLTDTAYLTALGTFLNLETPERLTPEEAEQFIVYIGSMVDARATEPLWAMFHQKLFVDPKWSPGQLAEMIEGIAVFRMTGRAAWDSRDPSFRRIHFAELATRKSDEGSFIRWAKMMMADGMRTPEYLIQITEIYLANFKPTDPEAAVRSLVEKLR